MRAQLAPPAIRVPDSLAELNQWVGWRSEQRDEGKPTKVPYQLSGTRASSTDSRTWCSFEDVLKAWQETPTRFSGIGFVFSPADPFFGIDLDNCLDADGRLKPWAQPIMERFSDSYAEISPSGRGIKIWAKGKLPGGGTAFPLGDGRVEIYDRARYFTATGNHWDSQILDIEELDRSTEIRRPHLEAALALWKYCEDSAEFIFGDAQGNQILDQILKALRNAPDGLTRTEIGDLFGRHRSSEEIVTALHILGERGLAGFQKEDTGGRAAERWLAASEDARKARKERKGVVEP